MSRISLNQYAGPWDIIAIVAAGGIAVSICKRICRPIYRCWTNFLTIMQARHCRQKKCITSSWRAIQNVSYLGKIMELIAVKCSPS